MQNLTHVPAQRTANARPMSPREWALSVISCGEDYRHLPFDAAELEPIGIEHAALLAAGVGRKRAEILLDRIENGGASLTVIPGGGQTTATPCPALRLLTQAGAR